MAEHDQASRYGRIKMELAQLPNEVTIMILRGLCQKDLKQSRLVCRLWASLGAEHLNFRILYLSPREKDMQVFDYITQHPVFSRLVETLMYDTAQFIPLPLEHYIRLLKPQLKQCSTRGIYIDSTTIALLDLLKKQGLMARSDYINSAPGFISRLDWLKQGFGIYSQLAQQQKNIQSRHWIDRVCNGLRRLGTLKRVRLSYTWDEILMINTDYENSLRHYLRAATNERSCGNLIEYANEGDKWPGIPGIDEPTAQGTGGDAIHWQATKFLADDREHATRADGIRQSIPINKGYGNPHSDPNSLLSPSLCVRDGHNYWWSRLGRSPAARSWPHEWLSPFALAHPIWDPRMSILEHFGVSDGKIEFCTLLNLLKQSGKQPLEIEIVNDRSSLYDLTPFALTSERLLEKLGFSYVCAKLTHLDLRITSYVDGSKSTWYPCLSGLRVLLRSAVNLEDLSLRLPWGDNGPLHRLYSFHDVFPELNGWCLPALTTLLIIGLSASYRQLASLLFLKLPKMECVYIGHFLLEDGKWEDFIEGIRRSETIEYCTPMAPLLYPPDNIFYRERRDSEIDEDGEDEYLDLDDIYREELSNYTLDGGRHPSLLEHEPDEASVIYYRRLEAVLEELRNDGQSDRAGCICSL